MIYRVHICCLHTYGFPWYVFILPDFNISKHLKINVDRQRTPSWKIKLHFTANPTPTQQPGRPSLLLLQFRLERYCPRAGAISTRSNKSSCALPLRVCGTSRTITLYEGWKNFTDDESRTARLQPDFIFKYPCSCFGGTCITGTRNAQQPRPHSCFIAENSFVLCLFQELFQELIIKYIDHIFSVIKKKR